MAGAPTRILVVRLSSLGDVVLTTPFLARLKEIYPGSEVTFLVKKSSAPVLWSNPRVDRLWIFEEKGFWGWSDAIKNEKFDIYFDLHGTARSLLWGLLSGIPVRRRYDKRAAERRRLVWFKQKNPALDVPVKDRYIETLDGGTAKAAGRPEIFIKPDETFSKEWLGALLKSDAFIGAAPGARQTLARRTFRRGVGRAFPKTVKRRRAAQASQGRDYFRR
jgi:ADP-heptose:LPS heptosyltransferase